MGQFWHFKKLLPNAHWWYSQTWGSYSGHSLWIKIEVKSGRAFRRKEPLLGSQAIFPPSHPYVMQFEYIISIRCIPNVQCNRHQFTSGKCNTNHTFSCVLPLLLLPSFPPWALLSLLLLLVASSSEPPAPLHSANASSWLTAPEGLWEGPGERKRYPETNCSS